MYNYKTMINMDINNFLRILIFDRIDTNFSKRIKRRKKFT